MRTPWQHWQGGDRRLHTWTAAAFLFLLVTGAIFYFPALRGVTAGIRHLIRNAHGIVGLAVLVPVALAFTRPQLRGKLLAPGRVKGDLLLSLLALLLLTLSGIPLWLPERFSIGARNLSLEWHGRIALAAGSGWCITP